MRPSRHIAVVLAIVIGVLVVTDHAVRDIMGLPPQGALLAAGLVRAEAGTSARTAVYAAVLGRSAQVSLPELPSPTSVTDEVSSWARRLLRGLSRRVHELSVGLRGLRSATPNGGVP